VGRGTNIGAEVTGDHITREPIDRHERSRASTISWRARPRWRMASSLTVLRNGHCRTTPRPLPSRVVDGGFATDVTQIDGATVIHVRGEIDFVTCERLRDAIEPHLAPDQTIVLDFSGVEFMDSSCLKVLVKARGMLTADGGSLVLRNPSEAARRLLTAARAEYLLDEDAANS
jgi:anti-sigma B factor antagonist